MPSSDNDAKRWSLRVKPMLCAVVALLVFLTLTVPEFNEDSVLTAEKITDVRLSAKADVLVLRSPQHDYTFQLPENPLGQAFGLHWAGGGEQPKCSIDKLQVQSSGEASVELEITFGGYDPAQSGMVSLIPEALVPRVEALGFRARDGDVGDSNSVPLYLSWGRVLAGRQIDPGAALPEGRDLGDRCDVPEMQEHPLSSDEWASNHRWNGILRPFTALREGLRYALELVAVLFGASIGPGG